MSKKVSHLYIYRSTKLYIMRSKILLEEIFFFVFQNDVIIVAGPDVQSGYLIRKKDITTPRSAYETCHAMKGMIRGKEENETHQAFLHVRKKRSLPEYSVARLVCLILGTCL